MISCGGVTLWIKKICECAYCFRTNTLIIQKTILFIRKNTILFIRKKASLFIIK